MIGRRQLPVEILEKIFTYLERLYLEESSFVCKKWRTIIISKLREDICLNNFIYGDEFHEMIYFLSTFPDVALKVKSIDLTVEYNVNPINYYEIENSIPSIFALCPNIVKIMHPVISTSSNPDEWELLVGPVMEGHLQKIEFLPKPHPDDYLNVYLPLIQMRKTTLTEIYISNDRLGKTNESIFKPSSKGPFGDPWISEFRNLKKLYLDWYGSETFLDCDALIENCSMKHFKGLELGIDDEVIATRALPDTNVFSSAVPRPDIKQLKFYWDMLGDDIFIKYVMKKFPKLEDVSFELKGTKSIVAFDNLSMDVLNPFFNYLSNIPKVDAEFVLKSDQVEPCLSHFMNNVKYKKQIEIVYDDDSYINNENEAICVTYPVKGSTLDDYNTDVCRISIIISYTVSIDRELPHMKWWLNEFGDKIQFFNVTGIDKVQKLYTSNDQGRKILTQDKQLSKSLYGDWINLSLKRCISMKGLTFSGAGKFDLETAVNGEEQLQNNSVQHLSIRDLEISNTQGDGGQYFFNLLSRRLPSLNCLFFYDTIPFRYRENVIKMDMPFTSFDVIAVGNDSMEPEDEAEDHIIYLKLYTESSGTTFYYVIDFYEVIPVTEDQYAQLIHNRSLQAESSVSFSLALEIRCKHLNSVRLVLNQRDVYHSYDKTYKLDLYEQQQLNY